MPNTDNWRALREALEAGPTDGPWVAAGPSFGKPLPVYCDEVVTDRDDDEDDGDSICRAPTGFERESTVDMTYIAAANPATIRALLAELDRLREALHDERALDAAVAAERERWRELVEQLIACHDEPSCPAVALAREWLGRPNAAITGAGTASGA